MKKYTKPEIRVTKVNITKLFSCSSCRPSQENLKVEYDKSNSMWNSLDAD